VTVWFALRRNDPATANRLLARAYSEKRTLELRIPGAAYAPPSVSLGPSASFTSRPAALLKAEALIASQIESNPSEPAWLQAQARADVLEGKYAAAIEALRRALQLQPHSPDILTDLGTAYFQQAQQADRKEDLGVAYEYLSQALQVRPDDPVSLFNRAIVAERQFLFQQALDDWDHYLRVDGSSPWADEARSRAAAIREKLKEHAARMGPLLTPEQVAEGASNATIASQVDGRIEEYLHEAVRVWLPQAYPEGRTAPNPNAAQALFFLADLTSRQHGDAWLADLLRGAAAPHFAAAVSAQALAANDQGAYDSGLDQGLSAEKQFRASGNSAGYLRAEFDQSYADQFSRHSEDCRRIASTAAIEAERYSYPWLQIQLGLESGLCASLMGDLGKYERAAAHAQERAQQARYPALYLRALYFVADSKFAVGDSTAVWKLVSDGLQRYWSGQVPSNRAINLYGQGAFSAEAARRPHLQLANWREATTLFDPGNGGLQRAQAHRSMAQAALAAQQPEVAEREFTEAARLFGLAPQSVATHADRVEMEIKTAQVEAQQSNFAGALGRLTRMQDEVRQMSNNYLAEIFYSTFGEVQLRSHHEPEAEQAYLAALRLAEQNLGSLTTETARTDWSVNAAPIYLGLAEAQLIQGHVQESLDVFERHLGAPQRAGTQRPAKTGAASALPDALNVTSRLPLLSDQTVLAYGVLPDGVAIWLYDNRGVRSKWIPKTPQELQDLASNFYAECSEPGSQTTSQSGAAGSALRRDSQSLYSLLIAPVEQQLDRKRTLVIETEGFLARLPFEALMDPSGHYLIERAPIVHSLGPYAENRMHVETALSSESPALIVGSAASSPEAGLFAIPNVASGAEAVARSFDSPRVLKGSEATLDAVSAALPSAAVFHFAGHALATPEHTGLMLQAGRSDSSPVLLDAAALRSLDLQNLQLALLAACSTDSGEGAARDFNSVTEALQASGVPHVVATRWTVDALQASAFANDFYVSLLAGAPVSAATRQTSLKVLSNPRTAQPYYWAAFAAYGRP
jgi:CHAT domain-containing protein